MIGIDVLAKQSHFAHARSAESLDFGNYATSRTRGLRTARVGYHAKGAKLIASFLHGHESRNAACLDTLRRRRYQKIKF